MDELDLLQRTVEDQRSKYYGKYRAFIEDNKDPEKRGRCRLTVPSVLGTTTTDWALPCLPYGGAAGFGFIAVPAIGAQVVAEFLEGDPSTPMWTGTFWRTDSEPPADFGANEEPSAKVLATEAGHVLLMEDKSGEEKVKLTSVAAASMELDPKGSMIFTDSAGSKVTLDAEASEIRIEDANGNSMVMAGSGIILTDAAGNKIETSSGGINVKGTTVTIEGSSVAVGGAGGEPAVKGTTFMSMFNAHTHVCTAPGAPSGPPVPPLTPAALTIKTTVS